MKVLLDTNAYSGLMRGNVEVADHVRRAERVIVSAVVVGELLFGFRVGSREGRNRKQLETFLENPHVELLQVSFTTADRFARIAALLRRKGRPIPTNDVWSAAHALEIGANLLSSDDHFGAIDGLAWVSFSP